MKQVLSKLTKVPAPGAPIERQVPTLALNPCQPRHAHTVQLCADTCQEDISAAIYKESTGVIAMVVVVAPDMMLSSVRSPNALLSLLVLFGLSFVARQYRRPYCGAGEGVSEVSSAAGDIAAPDVFA